MDEGGGIAMHFYVKDHLGSNRLVVDGNGNIEEVNHYYPFGALMGDRFGVSPAGFVGMLFAFEPCPFHGSNGCSLGARIQHRVVVDSNRAPMPDSDGLIDRGHPRQDWPVWASTQPPRLLPLDAQHWLWRDALPSRVFHVR